MVIATQNHKVIHVVNLAPATRNSVAPVPQERCARSRRIAWLRRRSWVAALRAASSSSPSPPSQTFAGRAAGKVALGFQTQAVRAQAAGESALQGSDSSGRTRPLLSRGSFTVLPSRSCSRTAIRDFLPRQRRGEQDFDLRKIGRCIKETARVAGARCVLMGIG